MNEIPNTAIEIEAIILGAILLEKDAIYEVRDILKSEAFYDDKHCTIYKECLQLCDARLPIDILTVTESLRKKGLLIADLDAWFVTQLTSRVASASHILHHSRIVNQKFIEREFLKKTNNVKYELLSGGDIFEIIDTLQNELYVLTNLDNYTDADRNLESLNAAADNILELIITGKIITGIETGLDALDKITHGWQYTDLITIASRPSMGKTTLLTCMAINMASKGNKVVIYSLEMNAKDLYKRMIQTISLLNKYEAIEKYKYSDEKGKVELLSRIREASETLQDLIDKKLIKIYDNKKNCFSITSTTRKLKMAGDVDIVMVDYIGITKGYEEIKDNPTRIGNIAYHFKECAKALNIPFIEFAQMNRAIESQSNPRPNLAHLSQSAQIEHHSDMVIFIHRPEYYGIMETDEGISTKGLSELIIAKQRDGETGSPKFKYEGKTFRFYNWDEAENDDFLNSFDAKTQNNDPLKKLDISSVTNVFQNEKQYGEAPF